MNALSTLHGELHFESVPLRQVAEQFGTPCYVYSRAALCQAFHALDQAFGAQEHLVCYAVKANSNLGILNLLARLGAGFDIVSGGELQRVLAAGGDPGKVVFSGVGKTTAEMRQALEAGILCFNVESESELLRLSQIAASLGKPAPISLRVNPDVDPKTHPYISTGLKGNKFGVAYNDAIRLYQHASTLPGIIILGMDCHIGSQITETSPFADALDKVLELADQLSSMGIPLHHLDLGGGLGIRYKDENPPNESEYVQTLLGKLGSRSHKIIIEPGRSLVGNTGLLLTRVEYIKHGESKNFAIVDAAMNDLARPALYDAYHEIRAVKTGDALPATYEIVGPVCESGDFLGHNRTLSISEGDLLAVLSAGAYGMSMSSNYNTRPRAAEVMVDGNQIYPIRARETVSDLYRLESRLPD